MLPLTSDGGPLKRWYPTTSLHDVKTHKTPKWMLQSHFFLMPTCRKEKMWSTVHI